MEALISPWPGDIVLHCKLEDHNETSPMLSPVVVLSLAI
jgi:hypothetical protein